jgi:hypothetical protein
MQRNRGHDRQWLYYAFEHGEHVHDAQRDGGSGL